MTGRRRNWIAVILGFCAACAASGAALAQSAQAYSDYRQSLLAEGWKPVTGYGLRTATGRLMYKYPEVVCGPALCNAKWRDRQGHEKLVTLQRGQSGEDHRVLAQ